MKMCLLISTEYTNVTDRWMDRHTLHDGHTYAQHRAPILLQLANMQSYRGLGGQSVTVMPVNNYWMLMN